jgi:hypothetical protein
MCTFSGVMHEGGRQEAGGKWPFQTRAQYTRARIPTRAHVWREGGEWDEIYKAGSIEHAADYAGQERRWQVEVRVLCAAQRHRPAASAHARVHRLKIHTHTPAYSRTHLLAHIRRAHIRAHARMRKNARLHARPPAHTHARTHAHARVRSRTHTHTRRRARTHTHARLADCVGGTAWQCRGVRHCEAIECEWCADRDRPLRSR